LEVGAGARWVGGARGVGNRVRAWEGKRVARPITRGRHAVGGDVGTCCSQSGAEGAAFVSTSMVCLLNLDRQYGQRENCGS
jgi:hypothetical protein